MAIYIYPGDKVQVRCSCGKQVEITAPVVCPDCVQAVGDFLSTRNLRLEGDPEDPDCQAQAVIVVTERGRENWPVWSW